VAASAQGCHLLDYRSWSSLDAVKLVGCCCTVSLHLNFGLQSSVCVLSLSVRTRRR